MMPQAIAAEIPLADGVKPKDSMLREDESNSSYAPSSSLLRTITVYLGIICL